jgi:hypothetical protein
LNRRHVVNVLAVNSLRYQYVEDDFNVSKSKISIYHFIRRERHSFSQAAYKNRMKEEGNGDSSMAAESEDKSMEIRGNG